MLGRWGQEGIWECKEQSCIPQLCQIQLYLVYFNPETLKSSCKTFRTRC